jgi:hypothetical protein
LLGIPTLLQGQYRHHGGLREVDGGSNNNDRRGFWLGIGLGGGAESFDAKDGLGWSEEHWGGAAHLKLGGTVSQNFLLGAELQGWGRNYGSYDRSLSSLMIIGQWYVIPRGPIFVKGGLGLTRDQFTNRVLGGPPDFHQDGTGLVLGVGLDGRVARNVSITPFLDLIAHRYRDQDERLLNIGVGVTFH